MLLCSPQYLADTTAFQLAVLRNIERRVVRMVALKQHNNKCRRARERVPVLSEGEYKERRRIECEERTRTTRMRTEQAVTQ